MSISFECEHCGKEVSAPAEAAGRRGKCPFCHQSSYIPDPNVDEEIPLAPVDEEEERAIEEEERRLQEAERALIAETGAELPPESGGSTAAGSEKVSPEQLYHHVVNYCLEMSNSNLEKARDSANRLKQHGYDGLQAVDDFITGKALEPALDPIPTKLCRGFLDQLRNEVRNQ
ncbi:MAG: hypothetical protein ACLFV7_14195 [Phycisphaerae bacterium]